MSGDLLALGAIFTLAAAGLAKGGSRNQLAVEDAQKHIRDMISGDRDFVVTEGWTLIDIYDVSTLTARYEYHDFHQAEPLSGVKRLLKMLEDAGFSSTSYRYGNKIWQLKAGEAEICVRLLRGGEQGGLVEIDMYEVTPKRLLSGLDGGPWGQARSKRALSFWKDEDSDAR